MLRLIQSELVNELGVRLFKLGVLFLQSLARRAKLQGGRQHGVGRAHEERVRRGAGKHRLPVGFARDRRGEEEPPQDLPPAMHGDIEDLLRVAVEEPRARRVHPARRIPWTADPRGALCRDDPTDRVAGVLEAAPRVELRLTSATPRDDDERAVLLLEDGGAEPPGGHDPARALAYLEPEGRQSPQIAEPKERLVQRAEHEQAARRARTGVADVPRFAHGVESSGIPLASAQMFRNEFRATAMITSRISGSLKP